MAHFYGSIQGSRGEATRMGDRNSGINGYVQSHHVRIATGMSHDRGERDKDSASITICAGHSNYNSGQLNLYFRDIDKFLDAITTSDAKVQKHVMKIRQSIQIIEDEAEGAIRRQKRRDKIKANKLERERKTEEKRKAELRESITGEELRQFMSLVEGYTPDLTAGQMRDMITHHHSNTAERDDIGHLIFTKNSGWDFTVYNLTTGTIIKDTREKEDAA